MGHGRVGGSGGQPRRCDQGPVHHKGLQDGRDFLLRQHNWLREPPLARCSPSKGGDRPSRSHNGQRPCLASSHLPEGLARCCTPALQTTTYSGGLPAGRRWQVGLVVVGRWPVPPRAAAWQHTDHLSCQIQTRLFPRRPLGTKPSSGWSG